MNVFRIMGLASCILVNTVAFAQEQNPVLIGKALSELTQAEVDGFAKIDIDLDGSVQLTTDGLLILRYLFLYRGNRLIENALGPGAQITDFVDIENRLASQVLLLDLDQDGSVLPFTDGIMTMRFLAGLRNLKLVADATSLTAENIDAESVASLLTDLSASTNANNIDSGSSDNTGTNASNGSEKTIQLTALYERIVPCEDRSNCGLDYAAMQSLPIRFAEVEILDPDNNLLLQNLSTDEKGSISFDLDNQQPFKIRVYARSLYAQDNKQWTVTVKDNEGQTNPSDAAVFVLDSRILNPDEDSSAITLVARSGWSGAAYTDERSSAPFAILDSIISASLFVTAEDRSFNLRPLTVYWSADNTTSNVGTSYYLADTIFVLGDANEDTDEFDQSVIIHEWGHYYQDVLSKDDSVGGMHGSGDLLDLRVAFSEGWANALSGLVQGTNAYRDSSGPNQGSGFSLSLEDENQFSGTTKGWFSEDSVQYFVFDAFDQPATDDDALALPISAMNQAMIDSIPSLPAASSIFGFFGGLADAAPNQRLTLLSRIQGEDIEAGLASIDAFGTGEINAAQNSGLSFSNEVLPVYVTLPVSADPLTICQVALAGTENKLGVFRFLRFDIPEARSYEVTLKTTEQPEGVRSDPDFEIFSSSHAVLPKGFSGEIAQEQQTLQLEVGAYWMVVADYNNNGGDNPGRYCQSIEIAPT